MVKEITSDDFEKVIKDKKVIVDCYAPWCGPCQMLSPIIDELARELTDVRFYKLNIDENEEITNKFDIMSIPTILIFENEVLKKRIIGYKTKEELLNCIKE